MSKRNECRPCQHSYEKRSCQSQLHGFFVSTSESLIPLPETSCSSATAENVLKTIKESSIQSGSNVINTLDIPDKEHEAQIRLNAEMGENSVELSLSVVKHKKVTMPKQVTMIDDHEKMSDGETSTDLLTTALCRADQDDNSPSENVMAETLPLMCRADINEPNQQRLFEYPSTTFGTELFSGKFNPYWYTKYSWLSYESNDDQCICFPCKRFENYS